MLPAGSFRFKSVPSGSPSVSPKSTHKDTHKDLEDCTDKVAYVWHWFIGQYRNEDRWNVFRVRRPYMLRQIYRCVTLTRDIISQRWCLFLSFSDRVLLSLQVDVSETVLPEISTTHETSFSYVSGLELQLGYRWFASCDFEVSSCHILYNFRQLAHLFFKFNPLII